MARDRKIEVLTVGRGSRRIRVRDPSLPRKSFLPWKQPPSPQDWMAFTDKGPEKDTLLLVWRDGEDRNVVYQIPYEKIPARWVPGLKEIEDLYLDLEKENEIEDESTRLLALVCCAVVMPTITGTLNYGEETWPVESVTGIWSKYVVASSQVDTNRVGFVLCAGSKAPPD